jgi:hypothetical protein
MFMEDNMSRSVGIWIDHRQAVMVRLEGDQAAVETVRSDVEPKVRMAGGSRSKVPYGPQDIASESQRDRRRAKYLQEFYREVVARIGDVDALVVLGPGEAKRELLSALQDSPRHGKISTQLETADKLSQPQLIARVREYFGVALARRTRWNPP